jgi:hypothetical protein
MECRDKWARKYAVCLARSFAQSPPTHHARLTILDPVSDYELSRALASFVRRLRYRLSKRGCRLTYLAVREWRHGQQHIHLLLRSPGFLTTEVVGSLWQASCPGQATHSYRPVRNPQATARYIVKAVRDDAKKALPPPTFHGRLIAYSRDFLSRPLTMLWQETLAEWRCNPRTPIETALTRQTSTPAPDTERAPLPYAEPLSGAGASVAPQFYYPTTGDTE